MKLLARNRKARFEYYIEESYEAGISLLGSEVKSIKDGKVSLKESYVDLRGGEAFVVGMNVSRYEQSGRSGHDPLRARKLLLHRREIAKLEVAVDRDGYTVVATKIYINKKGLIKIEIATARGKKLYDKRQVSTKRDSDRRLKAAIKEYNR